MPPALSTLRSVVTRQHISRLGKSFKGVASLSTSASQADNSNGASKATMGIAAAAVVAGAALAAGNQFRYPAQTEGNRIMDRPKVSEASSLSVPEPAQTLATKGPLTAVEEEVKATAEEEVATSTAGQRRDDLPDFSLDEISKHKSRKTGIWVTYNDGVYDITQFVASHPGGEKILLAAGGAIDPFWRMYAAHNSDETRELLETLRIGNLDEEGRRTRREQKSLSADDPYAKDPERNPILRINSAKPFNAEPPEQILTDTLLTPNDLFYVRNHLPVPTVDLGTYKLEVKGPSGVALSLSLDDLKSGKYPLHTVTATVQCAGNRRTEMSQERAVKGLGWTKSAISTAEWKGVLLRDVLLAAGVRDEHVGNGVNHIHFEGLDKDMTQTPYAASIPAWKAMAQWGDVLLAFEMNGEDIPADHGYPVRVIIPGFVGARSVKWLSKVEVSDVESPSFWQQKDYKLFSPSANYENLDYSKAPAIQEMPLTSAITSHNPSSQVAAGDESVTVRGYAYCGGGRGIIRVDVSCDGGNTWHEATMEKVPQQDGREWAWSLWEVDLAIPEDKRKAGDKIQLVCKAVDTSYNNQPEGVSGIWNLRGLLNNTWSRVEVEVVDTEENE